MKKICAGGVVYFNDGKNIFYLLLKSSKTGWWVFPKGNVNFQESLKETALREIKEETGLFNLEINPDYHEVIKVNYESGDEKEIHHWLFRSQKNIINLSKEHEDYKWVCFDEAYSLVDHENQKKILQIAHKILENEEN